MSGIAGVFHLDHRPIDPAVLARMNGILAHRGPDDAGQWADGAVGLGQRMLRTTPEAAGEQLPLAKWAGKLVLTADARIDNRAELLPVLGFADRPAVTVPDSELILAAYQKWGQDCPARLIGDFAFALWDADQQALFCARDHFGIRPFYYFLSSNLFVFASEIKALFGVPNVPRRLNQLRVGYHLAVTVEDKTSTFYQDILRLLPGHSLWVSRAGVSVRRFWSLDPGREIRLESDEAYTAAFREIFLEAVGARLRRTTPLGSLLSGGLDSSAVTCAARDLLRQQGVAAELHTISAVYHQTPECDERSYIDAVLAQGQMQPHFFDVEQNSPLAAYETYFSHLDEPFASPTMYLVWGMLQMARQLGLRVVLDGIDGDTAVYHGDGYLAELARAGQWNQFILEAKALARHPNFPSAGALLHQYGLPYLTELAIGWQWRAFARQVNNLHRHTHISRRALVQEYGFKPNVQKIAGWAGQKPNGLPPVINRQFADSIALAEQLHQLGAEHAAPIKMARQEHYRLLTAGLMTYVFELVDAISHAFSIEVRHPFADRRLLEFSLAVPPQQKLQQGWVRLILRRALEGILPAEIQWRGGKAVNSAAVTKALQNNDANLVEDVILGNPTLIANFVDVPALQETYRRYRAQKNSADEMVIWQAVNLGLWLKQSGLTA